MLDIIDFMLQFISICVHKFVNDILFEIRLKCANGLHLFEISMYHINIYLSNCVLIFAHTVTLNSSHHYTQKSFTYKIIIKCADNMN